ncbi:hypothetical protein QJS10_CPB22g00215 [Acorus calamus]|uniref:Aminotransferase-like plant mobile domain-containing protein n=1 Tax=Acorus calamus TaxID=4465 RepID=A0AAV9BYS8_ACOCL|nr:hypothetical protein QJS10_CPB22g00215 [Acorus calamus]
MARPQKITPRRSPRNQKAIISDEDDPFTSTRKTRASSSRDGGGNPMNMKTQEKSKPKSSTNMKSKPKPSTTRKKKKQVRECHRRLMKKTPFNILVNIPRIQFQSELLDVIVSSYKSDGDFFEIGGQPISLTAEDVALIIGLPAYGETPNLNSSSTESEIKKRFFSDTSIITRSALKNSMSSLMNSDDPKDIQDFVKLWIAFIFASFLFPIGHYNCPIPLFGLLDDLKSTWKYAWSVAIRDQLMEGVRKQRACIKMRDEGRYSKSSMGYVFGCTAVLCAWFYEHTRTTRWTPTAHHVSPRLFKWAMKLTRRRGEKNADPFRVTATEVTIDLKVDDGERWLLYGGRMDKMKEWNTPLNYWNEKDEQQQQEPKRLASVVPSLSLKRKLGSIHHFGGNKLRKKLKRMKGEMEVLKSKVELLKVQNARLSKELQRKEDEKLQEKLGKEGEEGGEEEGEEEASQNDEYYIIRRYDFDGGHESGGDDKEPYRIVDVSSQETDLSIVPFSQDPDEGSLELGPLSVIPFSQDPNEGIIQGVPKKASYVERLKRRNRTSSYLLRSPYYHGSVKKELLKAMGNVAQETEVLLLTPPSPKRKKKMTNVPFRIPKRKVLTEKRRNYQGKRFLSAEDDELINQFLSLPITRDPYLCIGEKWINAWQIRDVLFKLELEDDALDIYFGILEDEQSPTKWYYVSSWAQKTLKDSHPLLEDAVSVESYMNTLTGFFRGCTTTTLMDLDMIWSMARSM